ncbi:MAG: arsenite methyltransferase [Acidimicrobiales bacterium]
MASTKHTRSESEFDMVRRRVREGYTAVAEGRSSLHIDDPDAQARAFGYAAESLHDAPPEANLGLGCGAPVARAGLRPGETVVDLGCGAGLDVFIASRSVGPTGRVIGVDMTAALLDKARSAACREGYTNVEFRLGTMEALPLDDSSVDVVLSNCAINLSPRKALVFAEAERVLRPGGRLQVSDLVVERELPPEVRSSVEAYIGCVGGAITRSEYTELVRGAGFEDVEVAVDFTLGDVVAPDDPRVVEVLADAGASYSEADIREGLGSIKSLSVTARRSGSPAACCSPVVAASPAPAERSSAYNDLLSYVVSNAVAGEIMAVENYSDMVALLPDVESKLQAVEQARDEGRHIRQLAALGARLGFDVKQRIIEPEWKAMRATYREAVAGHDLPACLIIQDLMAETMAIVLYSSLSGEHEVSTDDLTAHVAATILTDEIEHLDAGIARLRELRVEDAEAVDQALSWAHPRVMPQLFSLLSTSCESLCEELSLECAALDPGAMSADLDVIRARAATRYVETLDATGFAPEVSGPLIAQLAALEIGDVDSRITCGPVDRC